MNQRLIEQTTPVNDMVKFYDSIGSKYWWLDLNVETSF
jgi:hypothetical protein